MILQIVHPWLLVAGGITITVVLLYRLMMYKAPCLVMPYAMLIKRWSEGGYVFPYKKLLFLMRFIVLILLLIATAQLRKIDENSKIEVQGSDIVLALDMSGSMQLFDDMQDRRSRFDVAKQEVLNFIQRRSSDPIGLVVFGKVAASRCPVTLDKKLLHEVVSHMHLGDIDHEGTVISIGLGMAIQRLKDSKATSKVIILLTDGAPSEHDMPIENSLSLAKKFGVKIYTIGVGGQEGGYALLPFHGVVRYPAPLNLSLLQKIAEETGGAFFHAKKPEDVKKVYETIDALEKTTFDAPMYAHYHDLYMLLIGAALLFIAIEIILRWWRTLL
jgi:Ca-activated chloride channel homolog